MASSIKMNNPDVTIIGAGAAGLICAIEAGRRGRRVTVIDHGKNPAEKIRISGGGRCNFTNLHCGPAHFISDNPHFVKSALSRYTPADFIALVDRHGIAWHEKVLGQLFCDDRSRQIIDMLLDECDDAGVTIALETSITGITRSPAGFRTAVRRDNGAAALESASLVIATGGLSIPKMGSTGIGYDIARQFGLDVVPTRPALVPLTFTDEMKALSAGLSGLSIDPARVVAGGARFDEAVLFTHRGLSGPAVLQISSYWSPGDAVSLDFVPGLALLTWLKQARVEKGRSQVTTILSSLLPARLAASVAERAGACQSRIGDLADSRLAALASLIQGWTVRPNGTEGYRTAEVTAGGVDTRGLSSRDMQARNCPGLYFIGEVVDVTGHLGGHNFQWAWSSGWCAGQSV